MSKDVSRAIKIGKDFFAFLGDDGRVVLTNNHHRVELNEEAIAGLAELLGLHVIKLVDNDSIAETVVANNVCENPELEPNEPPF